ncbi:uncharacterized protein [Diadema antillarum]|uniref:uncharacterized protein n=1 Tax=Diadema antillarum TaxID=105358 RepID=UPI003A887525
MALAVKTKQQLTPDRSPRFDNVPKRYEETKPVQVQIHAHRKILDLGQEIHTKWEHSASKDKSQAIVEAEKEVWKQAEHVKNVALEKCRAEGVTAKEQALKELKIAHEKAIKEEALRVEGEMQKIQQQEVKREKEAGELILRETVEKVTARKDKEREEAVAKARQEEITKARLAAEQVARETADREAATVKRMASERAVALKELKEAKTQERIKAVLAAQQEERHIAAVELGKVREAHAREIEALRAEIKRWQAKVEETKGEVRQEEEEKQSWIEKHEDLKRSYQEFINKTRGFRPGQAEFLLK